MTGLALSALVAINGVYVSREIARERVVLERSAEYAASLIEFELDRLDENAVAVSQMRGFAVRTASYLEGDESIGPLLQDRIQAEVRARGYTCVQIIARDGTVLFVAGRPERCPDTEAKLLEAAFDSSEIVRSDVMMSEDELGPMRWAVPLVPQPGGEPVAVTLMNADLDPVVDAALALPGPWSSMDAEVIDAGVGLTDQPGGQVTGAALVAGTPWAIVMSVDRAQVLRSAAPLTIAGALAVLAVSVAFAQGLVILRRVAHQRDTEQHARNVLAQRIDAEERFVASMSHELRTPLNSIIGFARILESGSAGPVNEEQRTQLRHVSAAGKRLLALVNDLLDLSKARAGMTIPRAVQFSASDVITTVFDIVCPMSNEKGLHCAREVPEHAVDLYTDRDLLERILINIAGNAVKFTPEGGSVTMSVREPDPRHVEFAITDTGYGIPPDEMSRVMDEFFQGTSIPEAERASGTGLGLSISRRLVHILGGSIDIVSELGVGSTFTVRIPRQVPVPQRSYNGTGF